MINNNCNLKVNTIDVYSDKSLILLPNKSITKCVYIDSYDTIN